MNSRILFCLSFLLIAFTGCKKQKGQENTWLSMPYTNAVVDSRPVIMVGYTAGREMKEHQKNIAIGTLSGKIEHQKNIAIGTLSGKIECQNK